MEKKPQSGNKVDVFTHTIEDLDAYFSPTVCIAIDRYNFFHRTQGDTEKIEDYVVPSKKLAITCRFRSLQDELITDQVIMHCNNSTLQDRLCFHGDSTLQEVVSIMSKAKLTFRCMRAVKSTGKDECLGGVVKAVTKK